MWDAPIHRRLVTAVSESAILGVVVALATVPFWAGSALAWGLYRRGVVSVRGYRTGIVVAAGAAVAWVGVLLLSAGLAERHGSD